jgi:CheY-like chemotaxis protein
MAHFPKSTVTPGGASSAGARTVLWVEDDATYRYALTRSLEAAGYEVLEAADFRDALAIIESDRAIGLLISDIRLPKDTPHGFSIAHMARQRRPRLPILFLTAGALPDDAGPSATKVLNKSLPMETILGEVRNTLMAAA